MEVSLKIVLEKHRVNKNDLTAVKLRVIHNRRAKYYSIKNYIKKNDWNFCSNQDELDEILNATRGTKKDIRFNYENIIRKASDIINSIPVFSFSKFEVLFTNKAGAWDHLHTAFDEKIKELSMEERNGYITTLQSTLTGIKCFCESKPFPRTIRISDHENYLKYKNLKFSDLTPSWLKSYENYLVKNNKSLSTIGIHMRNIRMLFNLAIKEHDVKAEYPFLKYKPKKSESNKRALTLQQVNLIASYEAEDKSWEQFSKDMFIFSFLANGMNVTDIFRLKFKNVHSGYIEFVRWKNINKEQQTPVKVALTENLKAIIKRHGNKSINKNVYLFPILNNETSEKAIYKRIKQKTALINDNLKRIAKKLNFEPEIASNISTYYARHSFATILKNSGESIEYIKESLGHTSTATTEKYLSSFDMEHRKKTSENLDKLISNY